MNFISSLKQILHIFYSKGGRQFPIVFIISFLGIIIELTGLMMLYMVVSSLIQLFDVIKIPVIHYSISTYYGVLLLVGFYFIKFIFSIWQNRYFINFCYQINYKITAKIIESYYNQPTETYKNNTLADALNKVFTIGGFFSEIIFQSVLVFFSELFLTLIIIISLLIFNYKLLLLLLVILLPVCIILLYYSRKRLKEMSKKIMSDNIEYHQSVMTMLMGLFDVKLSGRYAHFFEIFKNKINALHTTRKVITLENSFPPKVLELSAVLGIAALFFITHWLRNDLYMAGLIAAFATATFRFIPSINRIIASIQNLQLYTEYIQFIGKIKEKPAEIKSESGYEINKIDSIGLNNITFSYPDNPVLNNISLDLLSGNILGITGPSGVGKSTLVNIISGLLQPQTGEMFLNNNHITPEIKEALLHKSAYVMQDPYFLTGSIMDNIVFGYDSSPDLEQVNWCINAVNLKGWLINQSAGLNTEIGDNGTKLSGGQKQRLAIARALYRKAQILILDEPSNSLDGYNKQEILSVVKQLTQQNQLITIIVSHDDDVLKICDSVLDLKKM